MNLDTIPATLRENGLFCCWKYEKRNGRLTKVPYTPGTGNRASTKDPATFAPLSETLEAVGNYDGIGVGVFGDLGAIDIDHCISDNGELSEMAVDIMDTMQAYTERSPSGHGLRLLFTVPPGFEYDKPRHYINKREIGLEVYIAGSTNKYVTVTGNTLTPGVDLEERGEQLAAVLEKYMVRPKASKQKPTPLLTQADQDLIRRAKRSKRGAEFSNLWAGDGVAYESHSEADIALCNMLAFWTNRNPAQMDRLFRNSGLMRPKWDEIHGPDTYGNITIQNAIDTATEGYDPQAFFKSRADGITIGSLTLADLHPEKNDRYGWNDIGNGNLFADWYKGAARYVPDRKKWFVYDGRVWVPDAGNLMVMELCKKLADNLTIYALSIPDERQRGAYLDFVKKWQRRNYRETILKDAASVYPIQMIEFDRHPYLYNCLNGTLDLQTFEFRPHSQDDMLSMISNVSYDPDARCKLWEKVIDDAMQGDQSKAEFLQKGMGYGLTGDTSEECLFILFGATTRNGKGTAMETYMTMQGDYGKAARPETIAQKDKPNSAAPSEDLARLAGARVVNISEPGKNMILSTALVKALTGNDTINARFLNENSFDFKPQFKFFINTNYLPKVTDVTVFSSGRVKVIPFERHFTEAEQDKTLKKKLAKAHNLSGILNWCLDGLRLARETGFTPPPAVVEATAKYQQDSDKIARFIADEMEQGTEYEVRTAEAFERYKSWCSINLYRAGSSGKFNEEMAAYAVIDRRRPKSGGEKTTLILGYKLKPILSPDS